MKKCEICGKENIGKDHCYSCALYKEEKGVIFSQLCIRVDYICDECAEEIKQKLQAHNDDDAL